MSEKKILATAIAAYSKNVMRWLHVVIGSAEDKEWQRQLDADKATIQKMAAELGIKIEWGLPTNPVEVLAYLHEKYDL